jgi:uncharacterized protein (TIGR03083 family)
MNTTAIDVATIPVLSHQEAMDLQAHELELTLTLLRSLDSAAWSATTDCPAWDVRAMYQHVLGACEAGASMRENFHQLSAARARRKREGGPLEASLSAVQVTERSSLGGAEIVERLTAVAPKCVRGRTRTPGLMRNHAKMAIDGPVHEKWTLGYLVDTIYLRDLWMHRIDASRSVGRSLELTAAHDGRIVADVVAEWARRHGKPFMLVLTGPAGGTYSASQTGSGDVQPIEIDAVEFCRTLAGRGQADGLLTTIVPF